MPAATTQQQNPFIKQLASSDRTIRDNALASLRAYLQRSAPFSEMDFLKLWKGLFFSMWMSDKPLTQQRLARDLADLLTLLRSRENFLGCVTAFWKTMAREWSGIDALRMDKYLYLVRCYLAKGFESIAKENWGQDGLLKEYLSILEMVPLNADDGKIPNGLRYHVIDIFVDELDKVDEGRTAPLEEILSPLRRLGKNSPTKTVRKRVEETLSDERLRDWKGEGTGGSQEDDASSDAEMEDGEFGGFDD